MSIGKSGHVGLLQDAAAFRSALVQTLAADPRPLYRWRRERDQGAGGAEYDVVVDGVSVRCRFERNEYGVERVVVLTLART